ERAVFNDRPAKRATELVPFERRFRSSWIFKEIPGVQGAVPQKFINAPVKSVGSRTCYGVNDAAGSLSVLGGVVAGENGKFLDGVDAQVATQNAARSTVCVI